MVEIEVRGEQQLLTLFFFLTLILSEQKSNEEARSYSPVNDKEKEDPQNGTYIGLTAKSDPQAWGKGKKTQNEIEMKKQQQHKNLFLYF